MLIRIITLLLCLNIAFGSRPRPKHFFKSESVDGSDDGSTDSSDSQDDEVFESRQQSCGNPAITPNTFSRIVGGIEAVPNSWPWQISVQMNNDFSTAYFCGGAIVDAKTVISAAHCFFDENHRRKSIRDLYAVAGIHHISESYTSTSQSKKVVKLVTHPSYNPRNAASANDIAILTVESNFIFGKKVQPVCLPTTPVPDNIECYTTGWGNIDEDVANDEETLRQVMVRIIPYSTCRSWIGRKINETMICAGYEAGGKDSCQGDSGGPLVCKRGGAWVLDGVVSWGSGCAQPKKPGIYTRVTSFRDWLKSYQIKIAKMKLDVI